MGRVFLKGFVLLCAATLIGTLHLLLYLFLPAELEAPQQEILIPRGSSFKEVVQILKEGGLLRHPLPFFLYGELTGRAQRIRAGEYRLSAALSPLEIMARLVEGRVILRKVTIPEGLTFRQIALLLKGQGIIEDEGDFLRLCRDPSFAHSLGVEARGLEGYLFPDTYLFSRGLGAQEVIRAMVANFHRIWRPEFSERAKELGLTDYEVLILASIIEKETSRPEERPLISAVFHNRMRRRMPLQSDPTVIYGLEDFDGNLTREDLRCPTPYNTYLFVGLPPTPICNPGRDSILAALYPAPVDYLYFVSRNDGTHHFSSTLREHNRAVLRYQKRRLK